MNANYRIILHVDNETYEHGDYENDSDREEAEAMIERDGLYGFTVDKRGAGNRWENVDGCWGFIGTDIASNGMAEHIGLTGECDIPVYFDGNFSAGPDSFYTGPAIKRTRKRK